MKARAEVRRPTRTVEIAGQAIAPGEWRRVEIPVAQSFGPAAVSLPAVVVHGARPGPGLFVSAAIHGDEINGVEIIRRLLGMSGALRRLRGLLIATPIVNVHGFLNQSRYLPDRRDLNRAFPGSARGSLTSRVAHAFMTEVVAHCTHGIDLHTASQHRANLPQIRACLDQEETRALAEAFGVPVVLDANLRDGSLRQAVLERGIPMLLYEAGEALRFDEVAVRAGVRGILNVMRALEMLRPTRRAAVRRRPVIARSSRWVRADASGVLRTRARLGARVDEGDLLGVISEPLGERESAVRAPFDGVVIGRLELPLVNEGDALFHIAAFKRLDTAEKRLEAFHAELDPEEAASPSGEPPIQ